METNTVSHVLRSHKQGFSLIEIAIVLVIVGLLATASLGITAQVLNKQRRDTTIARLSTIESAIILFVAQNKFLPCPAIGTLDGTAVPPDARLGKEQFNASRAGCNLANQQTGIVPWISLGLSAADAQDGWGNMFTYRVEESLVRADSMDFTMCTPAAAPGTAIGTAPNLTCSPCSSAIFPACSSPATVTQGRGLRVKTVAGTVVAEPTPTATVPVTPSTGAAYVVISHGENQAFAYQFNGTVNVGTASSGTEESKNAPSLPYAANSATAYLVDDVINYASSTSHFDDFVLRASILSVASKAQLGPRAY